MKISDLETAYKQHVKLTGSADVYREMRDIKDWTKEAMVAFYIDIGGKVISREILSIGILNASIIHPREIFRTAIIRNANAVIISHNHPSGNVKPSNEDFRITKQIKAAGDIVGIRLLDHVIVAGTDCYSFAENDELG